MTMKEAVAADLLPSLDQLLIGRPPFVRERGAGQGIRERQLQRDKKGVTEDMWIGARSKVVDWKRSSQPRRILHQVNEFEGSIRGVIGGGGFRR